ncbi:A/G-specific adenine glycosylase [Pseudoxanthobacter sp.]|uniref:A/G-specific adenine glycosylase n=1 Tax=Pseudoxanthobacter sp. TaxID=1925742 RepID=UPI002FDFC506
MPVAAADLLAWYDRHARTLPWRVGPAARKAGGRADPYRVWLSEVMLQQTTVAAVKDYFHRFTTLWPTVGALAAADDEAVMKAWAGLGYYARARNLKRCAEVVARERGGRFPETEAGLLALPGIGAYTAAAVAAIAFGAPAAVVDGNVERVVTRVLALATPLPAAKAPVRAFVATLVPPDRPGEFAEAMMDLGATLCSPRRPACALCPWSGGCAARAAGTQENFPVKAPKPDRPVRRGAAFVAIRPDGAVLVEKRPEKGLLGGMTGVPTSAWVTAEGSAPKKRGRPAKATAPAALPAAGAGAAPFPAGWQRMTAPVEHTFTHFHLVLEVWLAHVPAGHPAGDGWWSPAGALQGEALPSVFRKVLAAAGL